MRAANQSAATKVTGHVTDHYLYDMSYAGISRLQPEALQTQEASDIKLSIFAALRENIPLVTI